MTGSSDAPSTVLRRVHDLPYWPSTPSVQAVLGGLVAVVGVLSQVAAFWYGFHAATAEPPVPSRGQSLAIVGLIATGFVLVVIADWVRRDWLSPGRVVLFLGLGASVGGLIALDLPGEVGGMLGKLLLYKGVVLHYGGLIAVGLPVAGLVARAFGKTWWRLAMATPVLLLTGAHALPLVGLYVQAEELARIAAAGASPWFG